MAKTANIVTRIDPFLKKQAETVLEALGLTSSTVITMLYKQIVMQKALPFDPALPEDYILDISTLSKEELDKEIEIGFKDMKEGKVMDADKFFKELDKEFGD